MNSLKMNNVELSHALAESHLLVWKLNATLEASIRDRERLLIENQKFQNSPELEKSLMEANQKIWELNARIEVINCDRARLLSRYNAPLHKVIAERFRNKLRCLRKKIRSK